MLENKINLNCLKSYILKDEYLAKSEKCISIIIN